MEAGSIYEIDFDALPLGKSDGILHGYAAGNFFVVIGGGGGAVGHAALGWGHLGGMQQRGNHGGFAAVRMPHYSYVADLTSLVGFHGFLLDNADFGRVSVGNEVADSQVSKARTGAASELGWARHRERLGTSWGASRWPDWRATCPGLPSTSFIKVWADAVQMIGE